MHCYGSKVAFDTNIEDKNLPSVTIHNEFLPELPIGRNWYNGWNFERNIDFGSNDFLYRTLGIWNIIHITSTVNTIVFVF